MNSRSSDTGPETATLHPRRLPIGTTAIATVVAVAVLAGIWMSPAGHAAMRSANAEETCATLHQAGVDLAALSDAPTPATQVGRDERRTRLIALADTFGSAIGTADAPEHVDNSLHLLTSIIRRSADRYLEGGDTSRVNEVLAASAPAQYGVAAWCARHTPPV